MSYLEIEPGTCDNRCPNPALNQSGYSVVVEEKLDGHRALLHISFANKRSFMTTRRISSKTNKFKENGENFPHIIEAAHKWGMFNEYSNTVLDGEIFVPGYQFEDVQSITGAHVERAIQWQKDNAWAQFRVFDVLFEDGKDVRQESWNERHLRLEHIVKDLMCSYIVINPWIITSVGEIVQTHFDRVISECGEGLVLKDPNSTYGHRWTKMKVQENYDVVVMGFEDGKPDGKFRNLIGAVNFGIYENGKLRKVGRCSGMEDGNVEWVTDYGVPGKPNRKGSWIEPTSKDQIKGSRAWFTINKDKLLGTVVEVSGNGLTRKGVIRHPQFVRVRDDKSAEQCTRLKEQTWQTDTGN